MGNNLTNQYISSSFQGLVQISGSQLTDGTGSLINSLNITAFNAVVATSASYSATATSASYASTATSASHSLTSNVASFAATATSASYALTASYAENAGASVDTGSLMVTGSQPVSNDTIRFTKGDGSTFDITINNVSDATNAAYAVDAGNALTADAAATATTADTATSASYALSASYATTAASATTAETAGTATSASYATTATTATSANTATSASYATTASYLEGYTTPTLQSVTTAGATTNVTTTFENGIIASGSSNQITLKDSAGIGTAVLDFNGVNGDLTISTNVATPNNLTLSGYDKLVAVGVSASAGFTGSLEGTASYATQALSASYAPAASPFPFTGSAVITGSLVVTGSITSYSSSLVVGNGDQSNTSPDDNNGNVVLGGTGFGSVFGGPKVTNGYANVAIGGYYTRCDSNTSQWGQTVIGGSGLGIVSSAGSNNTVIGGYYSTITNGELGLVAGAKDSSISAGGFSPRLILGGENNSISNGNNTSIVATVDGTISNVGSYGTIMGARGGTISGGDTMFILGGQGHNINSGYGDAYLGGRENGADNRSTGGLGHNVQVGGYYNRLAGTDTSTGALVAGKFNYLGNSSTSVTSSVIVGGDHNLMLHNNSVVLGGSYLTSSREEEVTVPNLTINGSVMGQVDALVITSNTASMDCSSANFFTLTLANGVDTRLEASNIQAGQTINVRITNNAVSAGTISFGPEFKFEAGTAFTVTTATSAVDIMTFISFDGTTLQATGLKNFS